MACRNLCERVGVRGHSGSLYNLGMKYCPQCEVHVYSYETRCFCCGRVFRTKSRGKAVLRWMLKDRLI
ncbi:MAG: hypothetical protein ACREAZ_12220 [Nitrososphaera sp.]